MDIVKAFENYRRIIAMIDHDLSFWEIFLTHSIKGYQKQEGKHEKIHESVFAAYDIDPDTNNRVLTTHNEPRLTMTVDLERHRLSFYDWIENLILLKIYNASEIFLLQAIWLKYFPTLSNPTASSKASNELQKKIRKELNGIKSKSKDVFERHFTTIDDNGENHLMPKKGIGAVRAYLTDFSVNSVKFICEESSLEFMGMSLRK